MDVFVHRLEWRLGVGMLNTLAFFTKPAGRAGGGVVGSDTVVGARIEQIGRLDNTGYAGGETEAAENRWIGVWKVQIYIAGS